MLPLHREIIKETAEDKLQLSCMESIKDPSVKEADCGSDEGISDASTGLQAVAKNLEGIVLNLEQSSQHIVKGSMDKDLISTDFLNSNSKELLIESSLKRRTEWLSDHVESRKLGAGRVSPVTQSYDLEPIL